MSDSKGKSTKMSGIKGDCRRSSDEQARLGGSQAAKVRGRVGPSQSGCGGGGLRNSSATLFCCFWTGKARRSGRSFAPIPSDSQDVVHTRTPALPEIFGVEPLFVALALTGAALALLHAKYLDPAYLRAARRDAV
jgi:hypothetical protein